MKARAAEPRAVASGCYTQLAEDQSAYDLACSIRSLPLAVLQLQSKLPIVIL